MLKSFGQLFLIFFGTLFLSAIVIISLRTTGLKQEYTEFSSPLRSKANMTLVQVDKETDKLKNLIDAKDESSFIYEFKIKQVSETTWGIESSLPELSQKPILDFLLEHPQQFFYLNIYSIRSKELEVFLSELAKQKNTERLILTTPLLDTMKAIRAASPHWMTGHATSETGRMELFTNLYLEPIMDVPGDVYVMKRPNERLRNELLRRKIFVF